MNTKLWNYFKKSEEYKNTTNVFGPDGSEKDIYEYALSKGWISKKDNYPRCSEIVDDSMRRLNVDYKNLSRLSYESIIEGIVIPNRSGQKSNYRELLEWVINLSIYLFPRNSFFKPILLTAPFYQFENACKEIGIVFPEYPKSKDYKGFLMWYYDLCEAIHDFEIRYRLTPSETCACMYEFAFACIDDVERGDLPVPQYVWIVGANDINQLSSGSTDQMWQCNERTRRGDIIVVYATSKYPNKKAGCSSSIHSIWRAESPISFNPFLYYQYQTELRDPCYLSSPISLDELQKNEKLKGLKMLNNNLQGLNGKNIPVKEYEAIIDMIRDAGNDMPIHELCEKTSWEPPKEMETDTETDPEKKVEEYILKPFLENKLNYNINDPSQIKTQLRLKKGRGLLEIPDFVFFPFGEKYNEHAPLMIEVKDEMKSPNDIKKNFMQATSYAESLNSHYLGICDRNFLRIYKRNRDGFFHYDDEAIFDAQWSKIYSDPVEFMKVRNIMSPEVLKQLKNQ